MRQGALVQGPAGRRMGIVGCLIMVLAALALPATAGAATHAPAYANGHAYRHGAVPTRGHQHTVAANSPGITAAAAAPELAYGGGNAGVGVTTGAPRVYLVFWGSQWATAGTNSGGYATYSGDPKGIAPDLQAFFKGLGTSGETWSGVMTQYCQGVATGAISCPSSNTQHVGYPTGGALAGVWEDTSAPAPAQATGHQIGAEAVSAATHFGNTTQASNRNTQYVIVSPTGTNPDAYKTGGFCAWHDDTADSTLSGGAVSSADGTLAFTNLPYIPDAGSSCGQGFVNNPGTLDGVTIVEGHEYAETVTDQFPAGGWTDSSGAENGDKCAWISSGQGASQNITLSTGTFAVQSTWANDYNGGAGGCEVTHPIVTNPGANTVTVTNPGTQTATVGSSTSLQISAQDSASGQTLTYSAAGLPAGLSINASTGLISGTPTTAGTSSVTVTAKDTTGASGGTAFTWTVSAPAGNSVTVTNPGTQTSTVGSAASLQISAHDSASGQTLTYSAAGLPAGLSINPSTGLISGTPTTAGSSSVTVRASDTTGAAGSTAFTWTVNNPSSCTAAQLLGNPGFETGSAAPWTSTAGVINPNGAGQTAHSGSYYAWLDGYGTTHTDTLAQKVTIPSGCTHDTFSFYLHIDTAETTTTTAYDVLKVQVLNSAGTVVGTLATYSNLNAAAGYTLRSLDLSAYAGQAITLKFTGTEDVSLQTSFVIDDTSLNVS